MTDYKAEGWTETEIDREEWACLNPKPEGPHKAIKTAEFFNGTEHDRQAFTWLRLDPPAPKFREGEMRMYRAYLLTFRDGSWRYPNGFVPVNLDEAHLSEPVVVVPAPTDEELAHFLQHFSKRASWIERVWPWLSRVADHFSNQEARDE